MIEEPLWKRQAAAMQDAGMPGDDLTHEEVTAQVWDTFVGAPPVPVAPVRTQFTYPTREEMAAEVSRGLVYVGPATRLRTDGEDYSALLQPVSAALSEACPLCGRVGLRNVVHECYPPLPDDTAEFTPAERAAIRRFLRGSGVL